jgi:hypothetical protein
MLLFKSIGDFVGFIFGQRAVQVGECKLTLAAKTKQRLDVAICFFFFIKLNRAFTEIRLFNKIIVFINLKVNTDSQEALSLGLSLYSSFVWFIHNFRIG